MNDNGFKLRNAPIIEAVLDIDCDMPPGQEIAALEKLACENYREHYPKFRTVFVEQHQIVSKVDQPPETSVRRAVQAYQFLHPDEKQLVQLRTQGFSFNRLAPYSTLDDYLAEIERTWRIFVQVASPVRIRAVRLRYINRILLPFEATRVELEDYLTIGPRLPDEEHLTFIGFFNQHAAIEVGTRNEVNTVLTTQHPENDHLPMIFDITVTSGKTAEIENWAWLLGQIQSLRTLKNDVFRKTLTERCLNLFQQH